MNAVFPKTFDKPKLFCEHYFSRPLPKEFQRYIYNELNFKLVNSLVLRE